jgi:glycerol-3-phosphate acyltransferase PlsY
MIHPISWAYAWPYVAAALGFGYVLGSIPFGLVLTRLAGLGDIRRIGSGNIGATNVLRTGNKALAAATLILDGGKGTVAVLLADVYGPDMAIVAAAGAITGHLFPVWLRFRGGKGVATALGVLLALSWPVGLAACLTWLAAAALFRYSSLAALLALAASPGYAILFADPQRKEFAIALAAVICLTHAKNIRRLVTGTEPKIGRKASPH